MISTFKFDVIVYCDHAVIILLHCRIGHDNAGLAAAWYLDRVEIEVPSLGKKWLATCERYVIKRFTQNAHNKPLSP